MVIIECLHLHTTTPFIMLQELSVTQQLGLGTQNSIRLLLSIQLRLVVFLTTFNLNSGPELVLTREKG